MGKFAFIIHPREAEDIARIFPIARYLPGWLAERAAVRLPPFRLPGMTGIESPFAGAEGFLIAVPLTMLQIRRLPGNIIADRISRAIRLAEKLGAGVIGLGGLAPAAERAGIDPDGFKTAVTGGISFTIATAMEAVGEAANMMGHDLRKSNAVVLGASGPVERVCAQVLSAKVSRMTLVGKDKRKLEELAGKILFHCGLSVRLSVDAKSSLRSAGIVVAGPEAGFVCPRDLPPGAVVCVLAGTGLSVWGQAGARDDVLVVEGGLVSVPGSFKKKIDPEYPPGMISAPLAEVVIMALEGVRRDMTGFGVSFEKVSKMASLAIKHGFKTAGIKGCRSVITMADIESIRCNARKNGLGGAVIP